ncbi:class I SAM-dependent methyltransferase [Neobacillus niacini]|uniref:class I SAM-dependent methyltransferase n=1 Tax=Neobacillus niacini TaxID=86668 RepID=UPI00203EA3A4|nr:class I SAM-dependent methyltransferase [Neobacillus niacini]MCM3690950.1 class I SAM-dependent methyltransferase [Neobacillus niacini]
MSQPTSETNDFITSYFEKVSMPFHKGIEDFEDYLYNQHPKRTIDRILKMMGNRMDEGGNIYTNIYRRKNEYLRLSLDISSFSSNQYKHFFEWLMSLPDINPTKILDIGCDNGFASCFYASLFPTSQVIGIDVNEKALECAKELALQLDLQNIEFKKLDFANIENQFSPDSFDLIVSLCSLHEIAQPILLPRSWSFKEGVQLAEESFKKVDTITKLESLLMEHGAILSMERLPNVEIIAARAVSFEKSDIYVDWSKTKKITYDESGKPQTMPAFYLSKQKPDQNITEGAMNLYLNRDLLSSSFGTHLTDEEAEVQFHEVENKELVLGMQMMYYNGSGTMRMEVWKTGAKFLAYRYSNTGYRDLKIVPKGTLTTIKKEFKKMEEEFEAYANVSFYKNIEERDQLEVI